MRQSKRGIKIPKQGDISHKMAYGSTFGLLIKCMPIKWNANVNSQCVMHLLWVCLWLRDTIMNVVGVTRVMRVTDIWTNCLWWAIHNSIHDHIRGERHLRVVFCLVHITAVSITYVPLLYLIRWITFTVVLSHIV